MARKGLNIYKRKDGRWEARYIKSRNTQGKPRYGYLYATSYHEVRNNLQRVIQAMNTYDAENSWAFLLYGLKIHRPVRRNQRIFATALY